ncbi:MAG: TonB-dependent receptor domain-containing protein [Cyclobacteriaceae bacterium]
MNLPTYSLKLLLGPILMIGSFNYLCAQVTYLGEVKDQNRQAVSFANVLLLHSADSSLVVGTISDAEGTFSLEAQPGDYILQIAMIGYQAVYSSIDKSLATTGDLGSFLLAESTRELDEVVIRAQKPLFEKQMDRTVVNVQSSITSAGSTVLEILEKSPGVIVNRQNNSLALNGKNGVLVMINGKISRMPTEAVVQMLNGMSAANIEKIELITTPPAKYDAEGNAGIIHLVMAENTDLGTNGNFGITGGYNSGETWGANATVNHRGIRFNTFLNYSIRSDRQVNVWRNSRFTTEDDFIWKDVNINRREPITTVQNLQAGLEFNLNPRTDVSVLVTGYRRNWNTTDNISSVNTVSPDSTLRTTTDAREINRWQSATASLGIRHKLTDRQQLDVSLDYLYYHQNQPSSYLRNSQLDNSELVSEEFIAVEKQTPIHFEIGSVDYSNNVNDAFSFEVGLKGSISHFTNDVVTTRTAVGTTALDPMFTNNARLDEKILAGYTSFNWQAGTLWNVQGGLRYEYSDTYMATPEEDALVDREFGNYLPRLSLKRDLTRESSQNLALNRRITRPAYNDLAPFVYFINPSTVFSGNLALRPAISDGVDLSYQRKQWWISLKYNYIQHAIAPFQPESDPETNLQVLRTQNLKYQQSYGIHTTLPITITNWWEFRNDLSIYRFQYETQHLKNNIQRELMSLTYNGTHTFLLGKSYSVEMTGYFQSASQWGVIHLKPLGRLDVGLKKQLKDDWGTISIVGTDLLNTYQWQGDINSPNVNTDAFFSYEFGMRGFTITYAKTFGNKKLKNVNIKSGSEAERSRVQ